MTPHYFMPKISAAAVLISLLFVAGSAKAQVVMTIAGPQSATPGGPDATFAGTITNKSLTDTYILSFGQIDSFDLDPSSGAGDVNISNLFFPTAPDPGSSFAPAPDASSTFGPGALFSVSIDPTAPTGLYSGTFGLYGYLSSDLTQTPVELDTKSFDLTVASTPVPEASTAVSVSLLFALGIGGLYISARRRSRAA
jgi:hypothetical protein